MTETEEAPGTDVQVRTPDQVLEPMELPAALAKDVAEFASGKFMEGSDDPERTALLITAQILNATTPEEVLSSSEAIGLRQHLDQPFELISVDFQRSEFEQGQPFYTVMHAVDPASGEKLVLTTGARKITAQVFQLARKDWLPQVVVCKQATRPTRDGYYPLRLESVK